MFESLDRYFGSDDQVCVPDGGFRSLLHSQTEALTQMKRVRPRLLRQEVASQGRGPKTVPSPLEQFRLEKNIAFRLGTLVYPPHWPGNCRNLTFPREI